MYVLFIHFLEEEKKGHQAKDEFIESRIHSKPVAEIKHFMHHTYLIIRRRCVESMLSICSQKLSV